MSDMLVTKGLAKTYQNNGTKALALRGVDLQVEAGHFVAVMGPSGCGKSTMLHLLGGLDTPTAGEISLAGERIDALSEAKRAVIRRRQVGFVFQAFNLVGNLTVADNVELPALLAGCSAKEARTRRQELLEQLGVEDKAGTVPGRLSGGQQQRVALARALVNRPALLLADEPTGSLDTESSREVMTLLGRYHADGQTIVLVTHNHIVASMADRVLHMRDGLIADETTVDTSVGATAVLSRMLALEA